MRRGLLTTTHALLALALGACSESPSTSLSPDTSPTEVPDTDEPGPQPADTQEPDSTEADSTESDSTEPDDGAGPNSSAPENTGSEDGAGSDADSPDGASDSDTQSPVEPGCRGSNLNNIPMAEASGAAWVDERHVLLVSDSGGQGKALILDVQNQQSLALTLPLGGAGDDFEGLERGADGRIYSLSSSGWVRVYAVEVPQAEGAAPRAELLQGPYALSEDARWVCSRHGVNCGPDFEGLCLDPAPAEGACAGYAASRAYGELVCLREDAGQLVVDMSVPVMKVLPEGQLSTCAYQPVAPYRLFVGGNLYASSVIVEVLAEGGLKEMSYGAANQEALLIEARDEGVRVHSFGDLQDLIGPESPYRRMDCP